MYSLHFFYLSIVINLTINELVDQHIKYVYNQSTFYICDLAKKIILTFDKLWSPEQVIVISHCKYSQNFDVSIQVCYVQTSGIFKNKYIRLVNPHVKRVSDNEVQ